LNFPGGTPKELVTAIEKASGKPLNAIIPDEFASMRLPALKMNAVTVPQLFEALQEASAKTVTHLVYVGPPGTSYGPQYGPQVQQYQTSYGFRTQGQLTDDSIWHFFYDKPSPQQEPKVCRFYQLGPYLETYKIEDITTAIETGWQMLGEAEHPEIKFHKDTKLLIAVGESSKLALIDSVLTQLGNSMVQMPRTIPARAVRSGETIKP